MEKGLSPFLKKMGMENTEYSKRRIEDYDDLKQIDESFRPLKFAKKAEGPVKSKKYGHECARIFSDHLDFVILPVEIPDTHIAQSPEGGQKQRDDDCNP
jgi:hypothetical protein